MRDKLDEWITIPARDGIEAQHGLNDTFPGDPVQVRASSLIASGLGDRAAVVEALEPFAKAIEDWVDRPEDPDSRNVWEHPIGLNVTLGDFRRAADAIRALRP